ncbi:MAG: hypothetical protein ACHP9Y_00790 [Gammaproteobacteria bacterium]
MSDYAAKLAAKNKEIEAAKKQLAELIDTRKQEVAKLVLQFLEKHALLEISDTALLGALDEIKEAAESNSPRLEELKQRGARFRPAAKSARSKDKTSQAKTNPTPATIQETA